MTIEVLNTKGGSTGKTVELDDKVFGAETNSHSMYLAVKLYLANQRQGTHKSKERSEIVGSTRKLHRQKGTGGSRKGDIKNPVFRGGGRVFGPKPRNYSFKVNKKVKSLARISALSSKMASGEIKVVEDFTFDAPKTKAFIDIMEGLVEPGKRSLVVTGGHDYNLYKSSTNLKKSDVLNAINLNTYQILKADQLILQESAVAVINELCQKNR